MLTVLGGLAEFERDLIRTRTSEGRERAVRSRCQGRPLPAALCTETTFTIRASISPPWFPMAQIDPFRSFGPNVKSSFVRRLLTFQKHVPQRQGVFTDAALACPAAVSFVSSGKSLTARLGTAQDRQSRPPENTPVPMPGTLVGNTKETTSGDGSAGRQHDDSIQIEASIYNLDDAVPYRNRQHVNRRAHRSCVSEITLD
jgi:hypothetical protein